MVRHAFVRSDSQNAFAEKDRMQVEENFFYILTRMTLSMRSFVRGTATASSEVMNAGTETHWNRSKGERIRVRGHSHGI